MDEEQLAALFTSKKSTTDSKKRKIALEAEAEAETEAEDSIHISGIFKRQPESKAGSEPSKLEYAFESSATPTLAPSATATATAEFDTEFDKDHRTRRQEALDRSKKFAESKELDTQYRGLKGYQQFLIQKDTAKANAASDKNRVAGPVRASANLRVTCRFDYKPDLCKDYNETGFCGFGDSCIFLHDRTEYKSSYQIEKEWDAEQERKKLESLHAQEMVALKEETSAKPTTCAACMKPFKRPVKTLCSHYFCELCVLRLSKCPVCNAALLGSFKPANKELSQ
jgi:RING finger protein 113A